ncbi:unnamed protein product [Nippostrongylus brasiliensis]|uniref:DUF2383 domain-containing protein n=1 Tax=Nippostrongylus brasiliensis TaxID=27835 RepID=A0A0N4YAA9_NIPBR|nr:unnamed protein product [Nippostrongylus brasiliensis]
MNDAAKYVLQDEKSFTDVMVAISDANQAIREVLSEGNKTELHEALRDALLLGTSALDQLRVICSATNSKEHECNRGLGYLSAATHSLVAAAKEVADRSQLEAIEKAEETFQKVSKDKDPELASKLGTATLDVFEKIEAELE